MSNAVTVFQDKNAVDELAPEFQALVQAGTGMDALGAGIGGNYAILSIRGKTFRVKYQGDETPITDDKGDAVGSLEAVIIKANPYLTKQFYEKGYEEGDNGAPVCFSIDGKVPSAAVENPQHTNCMVCPQNRFGSRITPAGVKVKACQDNKKLAIAPLSDLENKLHGGPMLFRVPASALKDLLTFNNLMTSRGYPYNAVAVRIGFDLEASYPKPTFRAIRPLSSEEAAVVLEHYSSDAVERLLGDFSDAHATGARETQAAGAFEQEPDAQPAPSKPVVAAAAAPPVVKATPPPASQPKATVSTAAKASTATPAPPPARAKPVQQAKATAPVVAAVQKPDPAAETPEAESAPSSMEQSIEDILSELNAVAE